MQADGKTAGRQAGRQAQSDTGLLRAVESMTQITSADTTVCGKTIPCFSFLFISTRYWVSECETKSNEGRTPSLEEGEQRGKTEGGSV